ncbi:DUF4270 family protein [Mucilaginibacter polytrichastri]|uniref:DUF4270 domain-containing protein n=1 Tax=Mucilaginibacter polytrichastri TaxID=1302689 RepID=A0A1Q6A5X5_9SPHI|nr:DUF4270 family protein [Mucilaginibacter polytrichastri]OKS89408.1 hypothetical protein RG47T_4892 [Mucilaginibacter polytrichastri]SFS73075.1 protein of unknown function [Mucilaginibacter polytrichastri]
MKFFRLDLLTLLISLFILNSCTNQDKLGLAIDPSQQIDGTLIDTSTVLTKTVLEDSVVTSGIAKTPLAYFKDPVFGTSESNIAALLSLPGSAAYSLPSGTITIDSAVLVLRYNDGFYGDSLTSKYKVNVYQLAEQPSASTVYRGSKTWQVNTGTVLGTQTFNSRTHTKFKITNIVSGAKDTLVSVPAQLRIKINNNFIFNNLFGASTAVLASNNLFQNQVKGLYVTLDKNQTGAGGRFLVNLDSSKVDVYYKTVNGTTIDTATVTLPLANRAAEIKRTYSTTVQAAVNSTASSQETVYFEGLGGLRTKISFPYLKNIITAAGSDVVLNRAELIVSAATGTDIPYIPTPKLSLYRYDIALQRTEVPDATSTDPRYIAVNTFGGFYVKSLKEYHFIITGYISDLMRGKTVDYGTFIGPVDTTNTSSVDYAATAQTAGRAVGIGGITNKASANYPYRMRLNIIYTKATK